MARRFSEPDLQPELCFSRERSVLARIGQRVPPADTVDERDGTRYPTKKKQTIEATNKEEERLSQVLEPGVRRRCSLRRKRT